MSRDFMSDDFTYWANLSTNTELRGRLKEITRWIEGQVRAFVGLLKGIGIRYAEYHIFPFDTRSISIVLGGYRNEEFFSLSLEDIDISVSVLKIQKIGISKWIGTFNRKIMRDFNYEGISLNGSIPISANSLFNFLISKYNGLIAEKYNLPEIPKS